MSLDHSIADRVDFKGKIAIDNFTEENNEFTQAAWPLQILKLRKIETSGR